MHKFYSNQISFKNEQNYYNYLFTDVKYIESNILILIHFPITESITLDLYHLFPIPINNLTLIPEKPYLLLNATQHLYLEESCHPVDEYCIVHVNQLLTPPDCVANLLQGLVRSCPLIPIYSETSIINQINEEFLIVIPKNTLQMYQSCSEAGYTDISQPMLIHIPYTCQVKINDNLFINDQTKIIGNPYVLPEIPIVKPKSATKEVHVYQEIELQHLASVQRQMNKLEVKPLQEIQITTISTLMYLIIFILIVLFLFMIFKISKCYKNKTNPLNFIITYVKGKPSDSKSKNQSTDDKNDVFP